MSSELAVEVEGLRVVWDLRQLRSLWPGGGEQPWRLEGEPDWTRTELLRLVSAAFDDGAMIAIAAARPAGAAGHDADAVAGAMVEDGEVARFERALISAELDAEGRTRRLGLELYPHEDSLPLRVAADGERDLELRMEGSPGRGRLDVIAAP